MAPYPPSPSPRDDRPRERHALRILRARLLSGRPPGRSRHRQPGAVKPRHNLPRQWRVHGVTAGAIPDRRRTSDARLDAIAEDISAISTKLDAFMTAQAATNTEFRDHITRSAGLGEVHIHQWEDLSTEVSEQGQRIRSVEDWRTRLDTYGTVLRLTFGASVVGAIAGILALINGIVVLGK